MQKIFLHPIAASLLLFVRKLFQKVLWRLYFLILNSPKADLMRTVSYIIKCCNSIQQQRTKFEKLISKSQTEEKTIDQKQIQRHDINRKLVSEAENRLTANIGPINLNFNTAKKYRTNTIGSRHKHLTALIQKNKESDASNKQFIISI